SDESGGQTNLSQGPVFGPRGQICLTPQAPRRHKPIPTVAPLPTSRLLNIELPLRPEVKWTQSTQGETQEGIHARAHSAIRRRRDRCRRDQRHLQQRCPAGAAEELPDLPPPRRGRAD